MSNLSGFVKRLRDIMRNDAGINGDAQRIEQIAWMLFLKVYDAKEQDWDMDEENYVSIIPEECRWSAWAADDRSGSAMTGDTLLNFVNNTLFPTLKNLPVTASTPIKKAIVQTTFADANNYMKDGVLLRQVINVIDELDLSDYEESHAFGEIYESILKELQSAGSAGEFYTPRAVTDFMSKMIQPKIGEKMADFACGTGGFITSWLKELDKQVTTTEDKEKYNNSIYGIEKKQLLLFAQNEKTFRIKYKKCVFVKMYNVAKKYPRRKSKSAWVFSFFIHFSVSICFYNKIFTCFFNLIWLIFEQF